VLAYASQGAYQARDPKRCLSARLRELRSLHPADDEISRQAAALLAAREDTGPVKQSLSLTLLPPPGADSYGGTTLAPGFEETHGLLMDAPFGRGRTAFVGRAPARATTLRIRPPRLAARAGTRGGLRDGFYAVVLPRHSGPVSVVFFDRDSHVTGRDELRR
jgi:hypothetical protein